MSVNTPPAEDCTLEMHKSVNDVPKDRRVLRNITQEDVDRLNNTYTYHAPVNEGQVGKYQQLRTYGKFLATEIMEQCPPSREKSLALTKVEEAVMWANAAIARHTTVKTGETQNGKAEDVQSNHA